MAFTAKKTDNSIAAVVNDFEASIVGGLQLLGYGYVNYSEEIANNFVHIAENFANVTPPASGLRGQLWWDTSAPSTPALWVCHNPTPPDTAPVTDKWTKLFTVNASTGTVQIDAWTLRGYAPSKTSVADTVVVRGSNGKIDAASLPTSTGSADQADKLATVRQFGSGGSTLPFDGTQNVPLTTSHISEGTNKYYTDARARSAISMSASSDGGLTYNASTGQFTYTAPVVEGGEAGVVSFNSRTGIVTLTSADISNASGALVGHTHTIANVSGLSTALNGKLDTTDLLIEIKKVDGAGSGLDADLLDGQSGSYYLDLANATGSLPASAVQTGSMAANGWAKLGNLYLQWGTRAIPSSGTTHPVTFPVAFPNACLRTYVTLQGNINDGDEDEENIWSYPTTSRTSFNIYVEDRDRLYVSVGWFAIGY